MAQQFINATPGYGTRAPAAAGIINSNFTELYGRLFTPNVNPTNTAAANTAAIAAAVSAASAAGGGIIQFGAFTAPIPVSASIVPANGVKFRGSGFTVAASGTRAVGGTTFQGNGTFPLFAYQSVDSGTPYPNSSVMAAAALFGCEISNMAADNCAGMVRFGAINQVGAFNGVFKNLYCSYSSDWSFFFDNFQECIFDDLEIESANNAPGGSWFGASLGSVYNPGNSSIRHLFNQGNSRANARNHVFYARSNGVTGSILNDVIVTDIQSNCSGVKTVQAATSTNGSTNIGVVDSTKFPVGMPVTFSTSSTITGGAATVNGFNLYQTYFVVSSAANVITVSDTVGGTARNASGNAAFYVCTFGPAGIEVVAEGVSTNLITSVVLIGTDTEGLQTTNVLVQNCAPQLFLSTMTGAQGANVASGICARNILNGQYNCISPATFDFDLVSSNYFLGFGQFSQIEPLPVVQGLEGALRSPPGFFVDPTNARAGLSFGGSTVGESTLIPASNIQLSSLTGPTGTTLYPYAAMMQKQVPFPYGTGGLQLDVGAGAVCLTAAGVYTHTLPQLTNNYAGTQGGNSGVPFEIFNNSAFVHYITPHAGDYFDGNSSLNSIAIAPGGFISLRAHFNGTVSTWVVMAMIGAYFNADPTTQLVTTGAAATVGASITKIILDGVGATFALTLPAPIGDGQRIEIMAATAVTTFSAIVTAPATVIKTVPAALTAGSGIAWQYLASNTSWYRVY